MMWQRKKILIWGKTRPELSKKHRETVCSGGVLADTGKLIRLYPIPLRYLDDEKVFRKYQWIEAEVRPAIGDARPESYNVRASTISVGDAIPTKKGDWSERATWVLQPEFMFESVSALIDERERTGRSLGIVKPDEVLEFVVDPLPADDIQGWWKKHEAIVSQP